MIQIIMRVVEILKDGKVTKEELLELLDLILKD